MSAWLENVWKVVEGRARMARRSVADVDKYCCEDVLVKEAAARGYHVARIGPQYFVFRDSITVKV